MARKSKEERLKDVHELALRRFTPIQSSMRDERLQCLQDRRFAFVVGSQWEGPLGLQYENKPRYEINKIANGINQIVDDYHENSIDAVFAQRDGTPDDGLADTCAMLHRSDEQDSCAQEAYDTAFEDLVSGGVGAWRLATECEEDEDDDYEGDDGEEDPQAGYQRIRFEAIPDADSSVFFDMDAKRLDKSDARFCFVVASLTHEKYEEEYPGHTVASLEKIVHQREFDWLTPDVVYVAEYFVVERTPEKHYKYRHPATGEEREHTDDDFEDDDGNPNNLSDDLDSMGYKLVAERTKRRRRVHKYTIDGSGVIEDCGYIAGYYIPVIIAYGNRRFIDNVERVMGEVRLAKDAQRIKNVQISKLAEVVGYSSLEKPIVTPEQIEGHEVTWAGDNLNPLPYLPINPLTDAQGQIVATGPIGYTKPQQVPQALVALMQVADTDTKELLGNPDQAEKMVSHVAGKAVEAIQQRVDRKSHRYIYNMGVAKRWSAQVWLGMAKEVYADAGRKMRGTTATGQHQPLELQQPVVDPQTKQLGTRNDLRRAKLDVVINVGPASKTADAAASRASVDMLPVIDDPELKSVLTSFLLSKMEGEGVSNLRKYAHLRLVKMGVDQPTPEEQQKLQQEEQQKTQQQPSAADQLFLAQAREALAKAQNIAAEIARTMAQVDKTKAETLAALAQIKRADADAAVGRLETLHGMDLDRGNAAVDAAESAHRIMTTPAQPPSGNGVSNGS